MKTEVWFDCVDGNFNSIKFDNPGDATTLRIPHMGSKVGIWQIDEMEGTDNYVLHYVVDVRHYIVPVGGKWKQEIHVMCSANYQPLSQRQARPRQRISLPEDNLRH
jgi:hypothetical protein